MTIGVAVLVSCVISLTLTPMLGSRFLREKHLIRHGKPYQATEAMYQAMVRLYDRSLYQITLQGLDLEELYAASKKLEGAMRDQPELLDVSSDLQLEDPELNIEIDR